jgi:uncharacterized protein YukE
VQSGLDGDDITAKVDGHLDYISQLAKQLGVKDPVETYLTPVVGRWSDLHDESNRWRTAAKAAEDVTHRVTTPLGGLDAAWQGQDANSFLDYMQQVGLAGNDLSDAMTAMADALDKTADGIRQIVQEMVDMLTDTAEQSSDAMTVPVAGQSRAAQYLDELDQPTNQLHESVRDVLQSFTKLCSGVQGGQSSDPLVMSHKVPTQNWTAPTPQPASPQSVPATRPAAVMRPTPKPATPAPATPAPAAVPATHVAAAHGPVSTTPAAHTPAATHVTAAHVTAAHVTAAPAAHAAAMGGADAAPPVAGHAAAMTDPTTGTMSGQLPLPGDSGVPSGGAPAGGATTDDGSAQSGGSSMGSMGGMGGMRGGQGGGDQVHKPKTRLSGDTKDIFGKPDNTAPPTIGGR